MVAIEKKSECHNSMIVDGKCSVCQKPAEGVEEKGGVVAGPGVVTQAPEKNPELSKFEVLAAEGAKIGGKDVAQGTIVELDAEAEATKELLTAGSIGAAAVV